MEDKCPFCGAAIDPYGDLGVKPNESYYCGMKIHGTEPVALDC